MSGAAGPLIVFALLFGSVLVFALRNPLLGTLAWREATRAKAHAMLVILGLMIGTATITAALVAADSVGDSTVDAFAYRNWGHVDITIAADNAFFPVTAVGTVAGDPAVARGTDGVSGGIEVFGSASNLTRRQGASGVVIVGFDPATQEPFGRYELLDGRSTLGTDLGPGGVIVSRTLAEKIDARVGDTLRISTEVRAPSKPCPPGCPGIGRLPELRIAGIARSEGPGAYTLGAAVFAPLSTVQQILNTEQINIIRVSAPGGIRDADESARRALPALKAAANTARGPGPALTVRHAKAREVELAIESTQFIRAMLVGMSIIVVAAGAALMVNITGMLAEERRTRLGVLRALGLKRRRVVGLAVIEGAIYALAAGVVGVVVGIGAGRMVSGRFGRAFAEFAGDDLDFEFFFSLKPATVASAFAIGSVLTLTVIFLASRRTSRMTITAAIRNLPEPPRQKAQRPWPRRIRLGLAALAGLAGVASWQPFPRLAGAIALIVVGSSLARGKVPARIATTITGLALAAVSFGAVAGQSPESDPGAFFLIFVSAMLASVFGLTIVATANLRVVERLSGVAGSSMRAMLRPPLAYLSRRPVRTGLTTGVFGLIIGMLTMFSIFLVVFRPSYQEFGSGYDVRVLSTGSSSIALPSEVKALVRRQTLIPTRGYVGPLQVEEGFTNAERIFIPLFEAPAASGAPLLKLEQREDRYATDAAAWDAIARDPTLIITNFAAPGKKLTLRSDAGTDAVFTTVGVQPFGLLDGIFASPAAISVFSRAPAGVSLLADLKPGVSAKNTARQIERALFSQGVDSEPVIDLLNQADRANRAFFSTIDVLMRLGLIVGILSLGIVAWRIAAERRSVIGVLRAIGYRRRRVMAGLMAEAAVTATIGVIVGSIVGTMMGWLFYVQGESNSGFGIDWANYGGVLALVYASVLLVTIWPAWRAAQLPPAEAVRYSE